MHSSGVWKIRRGIDWWAVDVHGQDKTVCVCDGASIDPGEDRANAKLISAAPELLAACENIYSGLYNVDLEDLEKRGHGLFQLEVATSDIISLRDAIIKAKEAKLCTSD